MRKNILLIPLIFLFSFIILFFRKPDAFVNPQFWAEDGVVWYADGYNYGSKVLFNVYNGFFYSFTRVIGLLAQTLLVENGTIFFNTISFFVQITPIILIFTFNIDILNKTRAKILVSLLFLLLPNSSEVFLNLTNSHWFLSLSAFVVLISIPKSKFEKIFGKIILFISGSTGPLIIFLTPISLYVYLSKKDKNSFINFLITSFFAFSQIIALLFISQGSRLKAFPDYFWPYVVTIFGRQILWGNLISTDMYSFILQKFDFMAWFFIGTSYWVIFLYFYGVLKGNLVVRSLIIYSVLVYFGTILFPYGQFNKSEMLSSLSTMNNLRYWFIPGFLTLCLLLWGSTRSFLVKTPSIFLLFCLFIGILFSFRIEPYQDFQFQKYVAKYHDLNSGDKIIIPINPRGWSMMLIKH